MPYNLLRAYKQRHYLPSVHSAVYIHHDTTLYYLLIKDVVPDLATPAPPERGFIHLYISYDWLSPPDPLLHI